MTRPAAGPAIHAGGTRFQTQLTEVGPVQADVPRGRDGSFEFKFGIRDGQADRSGADPGPSHA